VDRAARAMAAAAHDDDGPGIGYIETTPVRFDELFNAVCGHGWPLQPLSAEEFRRRVEEQGETNAALLALPDYGLESDGDPALATAPLLSELAPLLGERASTGLDTAYFDLMLGYLVDVGFLPAPGT
jgi:hypothetical protein